MPWRWDGSPSFCKAAPGTRPAIRSRCARISSPQRGQTKTVPNVLGFPNNHYNSLHQLGHRREGEIKHVYA